MSNNRGLPAYRRAATRSQGKGHRRTAGPLRLDVVSQGYPLAVARGQGPMVEDVDGNRFLDSWRGSPLRPPVRAS